VPINHDLKPSHYQALADFRYQIRRFLRLSEEAARHAGLEPHHHQLLLAVKGVPKGVAPRIAYLAERLQIQHHSAVELVDRLVKRGLIHRLHGDQDRREVHVRLTAKGERILKDLTLYHRDELRTAGPALVATLKRVMITTRTICQSPAGQASDKASGESKSA